MSYCYAVELRYSDAENGNSSDDNYDNDNNLYNDDDANGNNLNNHDNADICRFSTGQRTWQQFLTLQRPGLEIRETRLAFRQFVALVTSLTGVLLPQHHHQLHHHQQQQQHHHHHHHHRHHHHHPGGGRAKGPRGQV